MFSHTVVPRTGPALQHDADMAADQSRLTRTVRAVDGDEPPGNRTAEQQMDQRLLPDPSHQDGGLSKRRGLRSDLVEIPLTAVVTKRNPECEAPWMGNPFSPLL
jgi:hypothetical protein